MEVIFYIPESGKPPFVEWFDSLSKRRQTLAGVYIDRASRGASRKNVASLGDNLLEIKVGNEGLRIYFSVQGDKMLLLLGGGQGQSTAGHRVC